LAPDGNSLVEYDYLKSMATDWQTKMARVKLTHNNASFSHHSVILHKLVWHLPNGNVMTS